MGQEQPGKSDKMNKERRGRSRRKGNELRGGTGQGRRKARDAGEDQVSEKGRQKRSNGNINNTKDDPLPRPTPNKHTIYVIRKYQSLCMLAPLILMGLPNLVREFIRALIFRDKPDG